MPGFVQCLHSNYQQYWFTSEFTRNSLKDCSRKLLTANIFAVGHLTNHKIQLKCNFVRNDEWTQSNAQNSLASHNILLLKTCQQQGGKFKSPKAFQQINFPPTGASLILVASTETRHSFLVLYFFFGGKLKSSHGKIIEKLSATTETKSRRRQSKL